MNISVLNKIFFSLVLATSLFSQANEYTCYEGKNLKSSKFIFKIKELPERQSFIFEYFQDKKLVLTNVSNQSASELTEDESGTKTFSHYSANMTLKIYSSQTIDGKLAGEFNFYQPKVNGEDTTNLSCTIQ